MNRFSLFNSAELLVECPLICWPLWLWEAVWASELRHSSGKWVETASIQPHRGMEWSKIIHTWFPAMDTPLPWSVGSKNILHQSALHYGTRRLSRERTITIWDHYICVRRELQLKQPVLTLVLPSVLTQIQWSYCQTSPILQHSLSCFSFKNQQTIHPLLTTS